MARIVLQYPPVSSVWHVPAGIGYLTSHLQNMGHDVVQRFGHIIGLEYVLAKQDAVGTASALKTVRSASSSIGEWLSCSKKLEEISLAIPTQDKFAVQRNNVISVSPYYDGSIQGIIDAVHNAYSSMWYEYFVSVELPLVEKVRPHVYGISISDERQFIPGCILASLVKNAYSEVKVVLGGNLFSRIVHAFGIPEFKSFFSFCDAVVYAEGYQPFELLLEGVAMIKISGIAWCDGATVKVNPRTFTPTKFTSLKAPIYDGGAQQWSLDKVPALYTQSNCFRDCSFCAIAAGSDTFLGAPRVMTVSQIADHIIATGAKRVDITDEIFSVGRQIQLGRELSRRGYDATWQCYLTVTQDLLDPSSSEKLYHAGCRAVQLGLESLDPDTLKQENKNWNSPESYGRILRNLESAGIQTHVFLMVGIPGEKISSGLRWLPFLEEYGDSILTIKSGRYRLIRLSPDEQGQNELDHIWQQISVKPDTQPLKINRQYTYKSGGVSAKQVDALRDTLEQACRAHWAYGVTSAIPWWINRGKYSWEELRQMARALPPEPFMDLSDALPKLRTAIKNNLGKDVILTSYQDIRDFASH